jgi:diguanylate cyclase (GGDEF)-like protein
MRHSPSARPGNDAVTAARSGASVGLAANTSRRQASLVRAAAYLVLFLLLPVTAPAGVLVDRAPQTLRLDLLVAATLGVVALGCAWRIRSKTVRRKLRYDTALNNMQPGLLLFDRDGHLVLYNERFLQMYRLPAGSVKLGCRLSDLLHLRKAAGTFSGDPDKFISKLVGTGGEFVGDPDRAISKLYEGGKIERKEMRVPDGRIISITNQSTPDHGWVSIHEDITPQKRAEEELRRAHETLREVMELMPAGLVMYDEQDRLVLWNRRYDEIYSETADLRTPGVTFVEMLRAGVARKIYAEAAGRGEAWIAERLALRKQASQLHEQRLRNGRWLRVEDYKMASGGVIGVRVDITELKQREEELRLQNMKVDAALQNMSQGLAMFDADRRLVFCNKQYAALYGLSSELMTPGLSSQQVLDYRTQSGIIPLSAAGDYIKDRETKAGAASKSETLIELTDGRTLSAIIRPTPNGGWVTTHEDITDRRRAETQVAHLALHDPLTDLPNRALLHERLETALGRVRAGEQLAVLYLDLDHFKDVNDTLGHAVGDELLKCIADRVRRCLNADDTLARLGGDEFAVILTGLRERGEAADMAERIHEAVVAPCVLDGHQVLVGVSIGISFAPLDADTADQVLKNADMALYGAKGAGRGTHRFFEPQMSSLASARRALEVDLRNALSRNEFELYYQPLVNLDSGRITSCEALLRWRHPERGLVPPVEFIPLAEETGLIGQLGKWVLATACAEAAAWPDDIAVSVNISPVQINDSTLVLAVVQALASSGLPARRLEIEVTESVLLEQSRFTLSTLHQLRNLGVRIALDDFGTGWSSMSALRRFRFDKLKIDRSFIHDLSDQSEAEAIVRVLAELAKSLCMMTTAEGVETQAQLERVRTLGCTEMQGFLHSKPMPVQALRQFLSTRRAGAA